MTKVRITPVRPAGSRTAKTISRPPSTIPDALLPRTASSTSGVRGAGAPSTGPSAVNTLTWAGEVASTWATATASEAGSATATSAVSAWASAVAASTARSDATVRTSSASGTRNATSTSEVVAATSSSTRLRTGQSPVRVDGSPAAPAGVSTAGPGAAMRTPTPRTLCR